MAATTVYSKSPEAGRKLPLDIQIMNFNMLNSSLVDFHREDYLKQLIQLATKSTISVSTLASKLQFFFIKGGAEGFLDSSYAGLDASHFSPPAAVTTSGKPGTSMVFDDTDLLAVFDKRGGLVSSALLRRPLSITNPDIWTEHTANAVLDAWDKQQVSLYFNQNFDVAYHGLQINDSAGYYSSGKVRIDMHKEEATNGCIFIVDPNVPPYPDDSMAAPVAAAARTKLSQFEPQLILDVQKSVGAKVKSEIGTMRVIQIK